MAGTHAGRVNRPSPWPWLVPVAALVAGTLFASSVRASQGEDLRTDQAQLPDLIRAQNRTNETRASDLTDLQDQVDEATAALAPGDLQTQKLERQANEIATAAGRTEVRGPALRVTLDDAKLAGGEVPAGADPDDYVIHQQDVQSVVNALWQGGAEAMMLQDQRVISTSAVRCVGNTLILQGRVYSPPYVITAIGDRDDHALLARQRPGRRQPARLVDRGRARLRREERRAADLPGLQPARSSRSTPKSPPREVRRVVGWSGELLVTLGVLLLLFAAWQLWWTDVVADRAQAPDRADPRGRLRPTAPPAARWATTASRRRSADGAFAVVRIPRFGSDYVRPVIEGTGRPVLALGVGHYVGTAGPGRSATSPSPGTAPPTGARSTTSTSSSTVTAWSSRPRTTSYVYEVDLARDRARPADVEVIAPVPGHPGGTPTEALITLTSCHPKYSATQRFVVSRARCSRSRGPRACPPPTSSPPEEAADPCTPRCGATCPARLVKGAVPRAGAGRRRRLLHLGVPGGEPAPAVHGLTVGP